MPTPISKSHYPKFFAALREAQHALGLSSEADKNHYYRSVLASVHCDSIKQVSSEGDFDAIMKVVLFDAGRFREASNFACGNESRIAYCVKVMLLQICQLSAIPKSSSRSYFEAVLSQSRLGCGFRVANSPFFLDLSEPQLRRVLQILDTHLRRLKKRYFPNSRLSFDDRVCYSVSGESRLSHSVFNGHYSSELCPISLSYDSARPK